MRRSVLLILTLCTMFVLSAWAGGKQERPLLKVGERIEKAVTVCNSLDHTMILFEIHKDFGFDKALALFKEQDRRGEHYCAMVDGATTEIRVAGVIQSAELEFKNGEKDLMTVVVVGIKKGPHYVPAFALVRGIEFIGRGTEL